MAKMWQPYPPEVLRNWVKTILDEAYDKLNDWEMTFIEDIEVKLDLGRRLTQAQEEKLEQIYAEKTS